MKHRMAFRVVSTAAAAAAIVAGSIVIGAAATAAAGTSSSTVYFACLHSGALSSVSTKAHTCASGATAISWNAVGQPGATNYQLAQQNGFGGTLSQWLATLVGPQGPKGATGAIGLQGPSGPAGGTNYQLAVEDGFTGTLTQWLASLVGAQGAAGPQGSPGATGGPGATGPQGPQGQAGPQGPQGQAGPQGPAGPQGQAGAQGPTGGLSDIWVVSGSGGFGCFSSCNFNDTIASGKSLAAGSYVIAANLDVTVGGTVNTANTQGGVTCYLGNPGFLMSFPATGILIEGGSAHVFLASTLTIASTMTVGVYCPDTFTLWGLTASASFTATPVTTVH